MTIDENDKARAGHRPAPSEGAVRVSAPASDDAPVEHEIPTIVVRTAEHEVNDEAIRALAADPDLYSRGPMLAHIVGVQPEEPRSGGVWRPDGALAIQPMRPPTLRERLARFARWVRQPMPTKRDPDPELEPTHPPGWCVDAVHSRGQWPGLRELRGIVEVPTLRPSGTVIDRVGHDRETGFYYRPRLRFPAVPEAPTLEDAKRSADELLDLVREYQFADEGYRACWLAAALTPFARPAIDGPVPLFLVEANARGAGKTLLVDLIGVLATGRRMPRTSRPANEDDMRKMISSIALGGDSIVLIDNIKYRLDSAALEAVLTGTSWKDRKLGGLEMTPEMPLLACWYGTGNNAELSSDLARRIIHVRIEVATDRPELRQFERPAPELLAYARRDRARLVVAALTILRGYVVAGRPDTGIPELGGFDDWRDLVAQAVAWAGVGDALGMREQLLETADGDRHIVAALFAGWAEMDPDGRGLTVREVLSYLADYKERYQGLRDAVCEYAGAKAGELPTAVSLGKRLRKLRGVVANGFRFIQVGERGELGKRWAARRLDASPAMASAPEAST